MKVAAPRGHFLPDTTRKTTISLSLCLLLAGFLMRKVIGKPLKVRGCARAVVCFFLLVKSCLIAGTRELFTTTRAPKFPALPRENFLFRLAAFSSLVQRKGEG